MDFTNFGNLIKMKSYIEYQRTEDEADTTTNIDEHLHNLEMLVTETYKRI